MKKLSKLGLRYLYRITPFSGAMVVDVILVVKPSDHGCLKHIIGFSAIIFHGISKVINQNVKQLS